ncbi:T9SS type A sorting domain-containing protein [Cytophagaceae bacterium ABcell3]|nr:T9SS type A sorting domain-containing protein [Cytophagaceae bacterium ABcell3]
MFKLKQVIFGALMATSISAFGQTPATELIRKDILELERGQSIDIHGEYTIIGSKFGKAGSNGAAMLFHNDKYIRSYRTSPIYSHDGLGNPKTVGIGQQAIVLGAPLFKVNDQEVGKVSIINKTWDGTHYNFYVDYNFYGSPDSKFGEAVATSSDWVAVGAPEKDVEGGVAMYKRNSQGVWSEKCWLPLPDFENAPFRYPSFGGNPSPFPSPANFGSSVAMDNNHLIVGAPGNGTFYIYELQGDCWVFKSEYTGNNHMGHRVDISGQHAVSCSGGFVEIYVKHWDNTWIPYQTIETDDHITDVAVEAQRLVLGKSNGGSDGQGEVSYYQQETYFNGSTWVFNFREVGKMHVDINASPNDLQEHTLLGYSVAMHNAIVVSGAPNAYYETVADGAGFRAPFYGMAPLSKAHSEVLATEDIFEESSLSLYPNPAVDVVKLSSNSKIVSAMAISTVGVTSKLSSRGNEIDVSSLKSGLYVITVTTEEGMVKETILVQ